MSEPIMSVAAGTLGVPVAVSAVALAGYLTWLRPREARRSLHKVGDAVRRQLETDLTRRTLPPADADVRAFSAALEEILRDPDRWRAAASAADPRGEHLLTPGQRLRLDRYVRTVEGELRRYRSCARWAGAAVRDDIAALLTPAGLTANPLPPGRPQDLPEPEPATASAGTPSVPLLQNQTGSDGAAGADGADLAAAAREHERVGR
jgi:hypothetical protein